MRARSLLLIPVLVAAPAGFAQQPITIHLYDSAGLHPEVRVEMKAETSRIFRQAGILLEWVECEAAGQPVHHAECTRPLGKSRLMLQMIPGRKAGSPSASGVAVIEKGNSVYAGLYPDRVKELSRDANWEFADLLGHAAAHEIGHLLLESAGHSPAGVMRARWETEDLRRLSHNGLVFLPNQLGALLPSRQGGH
jgi:hypothetical protein